MHYKQEDQRLSVNWEYALDALILMMETENQIKMN